MLGHEKLGVLLWPNFKQLRLFTSRKRAGIYEKPRVELASFPSRANLQQAVNKVKFLKFTKICFPYPITKMCDHHTELVSYILQTLLV